MTTTTAFYYIKLLLQYKSSPSQAHRCLIHPTITATAVHYSHHSTIIHPQPPRHYRTSNYNNHSSISQLQSTLLYYIQVQTVNLPCSFYYNTTEATITTAVWTSTFSLPQEQFTTKKGVFFSFQLQTSQLIPLSMWSCRQLHIIQYSNEGCNHEGNGMNFLAMVGKVTSFVNG